MNSSSRDHATTIGSALDVERVHRDVMARFPKIMAALHQAELDESSAKPIPGESSRDERA